MDERGAPPGSSASRRTTSRTGPSWRRSSPAVRGTAAAGQRHAATGRARRRHRQPRGIEGVRLGTGARGPSAIWRAVYTLRGQRASVVQGRLALGGFERFSEDPSTRPLDHPAVLPAYNYFNFGAGFVDSGPGTRINVDLLNAFQSKGLEEGNPRLLVGGRRAGLPGPAAPAAPAAGVGELRLRRRRPLQPRRSAVSRVIGRPDVILIGRRRPCSQVPARRELCSTILSRRHRRLRSVPLTAPAMRRTSLPARHRRSRPLPVAVHRQRAHRAW